MILVTGATGFLGSELVRQLHLQGKKVKALKRRTSTIPQILEGMTGVEWAEADMLDYFSLERAFEGISHVYHCAATISFQPADKKKMLRVNEEGTAHIVDLCLEKGIEKLVHVSSVAALGEAKPHEQITEKTFWEFDGKQGGYSISKYESEMEVWRGIAEGLCAVIVNPSIIIGKNAGDSGSGQIFETVRNGLRFYTDGTCGMVAVEDVVRAMILLMDSDIQSERYILNAENITFREVFEEAAKAYKVQAPSIKAGRWLTGIGWRLASLVSAISGKEFGLTKETARSSRKKTDFSSEKFLKLFPDFRFKPVKESIREICTQDFNNGKQPQH